MLKYTAIKFPILFHSRSRSLECLDSYSGWSHSDLSYWLRSDFPIGFFRPASALISPSCAPEWISIHDRVLFSCESITESNVERWPRRTRLTRSCFLWAHQVLHFLVFSDFLDHWSLRRSRRKMRGLFRLSARRILHRRCPILAR